MRKSFLLFIGWSIAGAAWSDCSYFRVKTNLLQCAPEERPASGASEAAAEVPPELEEMVSAIPVRVKCSCDYSLRGASPLCELDQTKEVLQIIGSEDPSNLCRRGKSLCSALCPKRLP